MRDRRNTNLSISVSSQASIASSPTVFTDSETSDNPRFLLLPEKSNIEALPSPLLKHAQETQRRLPYFRKLLVEASVQNVVVAVLCTAFFTWRALLLLSSFGVIDPFISTQYTLAAGTLLSDAPEPVTILDGRGENKWTIRVPANASFPLPSYQYRDICAVGKAMSRMLVNPDAQVPQVHGYYHKDTTFVDPASRAVQSMFNVSDDEPAIAVINAPLDTSLPYCKRTMTFILESSEAGFGATLLSLWLAYGLAQREGRAFFIEDSRWIYGSYTTYFPSPPIPTCLPPKPTQIVPCPHTAAHLALSAASLSDVFGPSFHNHYQLAHRSPLSSQKRVFQMARHGYESLFSLVGEDAAFASHRTRAVRSAATQRNQPVVAMHIRRGDRHPFEYEFQNDYLPLDRFVTAASDGVLSSNLASKRKGGSVMARDNASAPYTIIVASDDPDVVTSPDLALVSLTNNEAATFRFERAQERIVLASKKHLVPTVPQRTGANGAFIKHIDQVSGWEGGFFAQLFRSLGRPSRAHHITFSSAKDFVEERLARERRPETTSDRQAEEGEERNALAMRELVGRGYLLDLQVAAEADRVVCAVSSATCRLLGVIVGWGKVRNGAWANVDDGRVWSWDGKH